MASTPMVVQTRPFSIEPVTNVMMPDGIFDNALYQQRIACHYTNTGSTDLTNVTIYLEGVGDPGIAVTGKTYSFPRIQAGASVLVSWDADFERASPGKPMVSFVAKADGFTSTRSLRQIFVSQTRYDSASDTYSITIPEGRLDITGVTVIPPAPGGWWPGPDKEPDKERPPWVGPQVPTGLTMMWVPNQAYPGTHGELPFQDPWWKVLGWVVFGVATIIGIIAAMKGAGTFNVGVKGEFEETTGDVYCCKPGGGGGGGGGGGKPEATVAGVAGSIATIGLVVGLADEADPHWRGQEATPPAKGELTTAERVVAQWSFIDEPYAGTPYRTEVEWSYDRITTGRTYHHSVAEEQTNIHVTEYVKVETPDKVHGYGQLWVQATFVRPDSTVFSGPDLYAFALFQAPQGLYFVVPLGDDGLELDSKPNDGVYTGGLHLEEALSVLKKNDQSQYGTWKVYVFAQDVNRVAPGTPPHIAAQTIGGLFVASAIQINFDPDLPCPLRAQASIEVV